MSPWLTPKRSFYIKWNQVVCSLCDLDIYPLLSKFWLDNNLLFFYWWHLCVFLLLEVEGSCVHPVLIGCSLEPIYSYYIHLVRCSNPFVHSKTSRPSLCTKHHSKHWEYCKHEADTLTKGDKTKLISCVTLERESKEQKNYEGRCHFR